MAVLTRHWGLGVALLLLLALVAAYLYITRNFKYWQKKGVVEIPPIPFFGNFLACSFLWVSPTTFFGSLYERYKGLPYVGFYIFDRPVLLLRDPAIIKSILIKDFNRFPNRYVGTHKWDTIATANIFLMKSPGWKSVRSKISPIFTPVKMKLMFQLMSDIAENLVTHLDNLKLQGNGRVIEVKEISARYTTDVITSCAFGLDDNSLNDPESAFRKCGRRIFGFGDYLRRVEFSAFFFTQSLVRILKLKFFSEEATDFMREVFTDTMTLRMESNTRRNDLIDLLIEVKKSQSQTDDPNDFKLDEDDLLGQAATFFAAGFESSAATMTYSLYELAMQPDLQSRLREEILSALEKNGGESTYEMVMNLPYLDMIVSETLRKYPPLPFLDRVASSDYKVPGSDLIIEKGTAVYMSLFGLHSDPEYFPEPTKYDPERFNNENKKKIPSCVYMPFGEGLRNCIGLRFGLLLSKLGILKFILNYEVTACAQNAIPVIFDKKALLPESEGRLLLHARRITPTLESSSSSSFTGNIL